MLSAAAPLETWHWLRPLPQGNPLRSIAFENGLYVAVGDLGTILTSPDGTNWVRQTSGTTSGLRDCAYGGGKWVAVGDLGTVLTSPDARVWTSQYPGTFFSLNAVIYGNGQFVAVGEAMTILTSSDAISWTSRSSGPLSLFDVICAEGVYVAVGGNRGSANTPASGIIISSADAVGWTRREAFPDAAVLSIAYAEGTFVAAAQTYYRVTPALWISDDGYSWQPLDVSVPHWPEARVAYGNGVWVLTGSCCAGGYTDMGAIAISTNLQTWSQVVSNSGAASAIVYAQNKFVMTRTDGTIVLSDQGDTWTNPHGDYLPLTLSDLEYVNGTWVSVAHDRVLRSRDGATWTNVALFTNETVSFVAHGVGTYVVGSSRELWASSDLLGWTNASLPDGANIEDVAFGEGLFVGVSSFSGDVWTSADGTNWLRSSLTEPAIPVSLQSITSGDGRFVAVGPEALATSLDGTNWHVVQTNFINGLSVAFGNGRFVAVGPYSSMATTDGTNWLSRSVPQFRASAVAFGGGFFVAVGSDFSSRSESGIWISQDGLDWSYRSSHTSRPLRRVAFGNGTFLVAGWNGAILQSDPIVNLTVEMEPEPRLTLSGPGGCSYRIEYADGPHAGWQPLRTIFLDAGSVTVSDTQAPAVRFYRAVLLP